MKDVRRTEYEEKPEYIEYLGDGTYYYNYDLQEGEREVIDEEGQSAMKPIWSAVAVMVQGNPNYKSIVKALIRAYYSADEEFDLINSYNEALSQGLTEGKDVEQYKEYLALRTQIKEKVKQSLGLK